MKKVLDKVSRSVFQNSWIIALGSLIWFILRTGTKPSRLNYPCQQIARNNIAIFGIPTLAFFLHRFSKSNRFRRKVMLRLVVILILGFVSVKTVQELSLRIRSQRASAQIGSPSRVVWVRNSGASLGNWSSISNYNNKADQTVVQSMLDNAILALTSKTTVQTAWTYIFQKRNSPDGGTTLGSDYVNTEGIAIKLNYNDLNTGCSTSNHCPLPQVVRALLHQMIDIKGIPANRITLYDATRGIASYMQDSIKNSPPSGYSAYNVTIDSAGNYGTASVSVGGKLAKALEDNKYLINMPLMKTHSSASVSLSFKNHMGSVFNPGAFHGSTYDFNALIPLNNHTLIKNKTILIVDDAIFSHIGDQGPNIAPEYRSNSLFLSIDPVAIDSVMVDFIQAEGGIIDSQGNPRTLYLQPAKIAGLGNYGTVCGTNCSESALTASNYSPQGIDFVKCDPNCPNTTPVPTSMPSLTPTPTRTPTATPTRTPTPTPTSTLTPSPTSTACVADLNRDRIINQADLLLILSNFGSNNSLYDINSDSKVNMQDAVYVIKNWGGSC